MITPKISIIIANYNNARYLNDCLESVRCQTIHNFECIVIDDGSTDESVSIIKKFVHKDSRFKIVQQSNSGVGIARNVGLDMAHGEYVAFLDSDDCFTSTALESLLLCAKKYDADIVGGSAVIVNENFVYMPVKDSKIQLNNCIPLHIFDGNDKVLNSFTDKTYEKLGEAYKPIWIWRQIFRRDMLKDVRFVPHLFPGDDICFILDFYQYAKRAIIIPLPITFHRISRTSVMNNGLKDNQITFFLPALEYIKYHIMPKCSDKFTDSFYKMFTGYFFEFSLLIPVKKRHYREIAAQTLYKTMHEKLIPRKYFTLFQIILIKILIFVYLPPRRKYEP